MFSNDNVLITIDGHECLVSREIVNKYLPTTSSDMMDQYKYTTGTNPSRKDVDELIVLMYKGFEWWRVYHHNEFAMEFMHKYIIEDPIVAEVIYLRDKLKQHTGDDRNWDFVEPNGRDIITVDDDGNVRVSACQLGVDIIKKMLRLGDKDHEDVFLKEDEW